MRLYRPILFLIVIALGSGLFAQETLTPGTTGNANYVPYVTELRGEIRNNLLRLSWRDSPDLKGSVFIYRSQTSFNGSFNTGGRRPVEIPYGTQSYIDEIDNSGTYYYFAAASDEQGNHFISFVPGNTFSIEITESIDIPASRTPVLAQEPEPVNANGISGLRTRIDNDSVVINFRYENASSLILYRSINPITRPADLLGALVIKSETRSPYIDYPIPGIPYYYAIIPEEELARGTMAILPGVNATVAPVEIPLTANAVSSQSVRTVPLPLFSLSTAITENSLYDDTPRPDVLSTDAERALGSIPVHLRDPALQKSSQIFPQDLDTQIVSGGEDYLLFNIVQTLFLIEEWELARDEFLRFLALPRGKSVEARARYYLGQCYYLTNAPREALFEFLKARTVYPNESAEWIQASLNMMVE